MKRVAFLASGNGTNAENLIRRIREGEVQAEPAAVICDRPGAGVLERAGKLGVPVAVVDRKSFEARPAHEVRPAFEAELVRQLEACRADLICLAGFMRILSADFVNRYAGRILNIHPALLPAFPGAHAIRDAFEAKVRETGVTVHFVDAGVDTGPVILQRKVLVRPDDTLESLEARIHAVEYEAYPEALKLVLSGKARLHPAR